MKHLMAFVLTAVAAASFAIAGFGPDTAPAPTQAPAAPTKAAAPTQAPAAPTKAAQAPTKKVDFPEKGRAVSMIVPWAPGGGADLASRLLAPGLEKELGVPVQIINKAGGGGQVGAAFVTTSKPNGYTIGYAALPTMIISYLDPAGTAAFGRKDIQPVAMYQTDPAAFAVKADSPYKSIKDIVDAMKAKPDQIMVGVSGQLTSEHLDLLQLQKATGARFKIVPFDGASGAMMSLLGGHIDGVAASLGSVISAIKGEKARLIATFGEGGDVFVPGVRSMKDQGYPGMFSNHRAYFAPAGTPKEIVSVLSDAMKRAMETEEQKKKAAEIAQQVTYMNPAELEAWWDSTEARLKPLMVLAREK